MSKTEKIDDCCRICSLNSSLIYIFDKKYKNLEDILKTCANIEVGLNICKQSKFLETQILSRLREMIDFQSIFVHNAKKDWNQLIDYAKWERLLQNVFKIS